MSHWHEAGFGTDPEGDARRRAPGECLECWSARKTYSAREVRMLPADDPRRSRVRPDRSRWTPRR